MNEPEEIVTSNDTESAATAPPASPAESPPPSVAATAQAAAARSSGRNWSGIALFLLGVLAGVLGFAIVARLTTTPAPDAVAMRDAARAGTLDAIATLQAGGPTAAQPNVTPTPAIVNVDFAVRETNRLGNPDAPVTIVEFSDFQ